MSKVAEYYLAVAREISHICCYLFNTKGAEQTKRLVYV